MPSSENGAVNDIELLNEAARLAVEYVAGTDGRPATPNAAALAGLDAFDEPLPDGPTDPSDALRLLSEVADPATMVSSPNWGGNENPLRMSHARRPSTGVSTVIMMAS